MTYKEAVEYIHSVYWKGVKIGLSRIEELLEMMGNPQDRLRYIHIAGTNGKGSTAAYCAEVLKNAGYKTGFFVSPYIRVFNERMQINNVPISDDELCEVTEYVKSFADKMEQMPSEFEMVAAIAFEFFARNECDIVVLEVGLGGRLDATNVIKTPDVAAITAIDLDHTQILGETVELIAAEKAGIIKPKARVVVYDQQQSVKDVFAAVCAERGAEMTVTDSASLIDLGVDGTKQHFEYRGERYTLSLLGEHQLHNAALAIDALTALRGRGFEISDYALKKGIAETTWPGRFEVLSENPIFVVDGAHNPHGFASAVAALRRHFPDRRVNFLIGVLSNKDWQPIIEMALPLAASFTVVTPDNPRALDSAELAKYIREHGFDDVAFAKSPSDGVDMVMNRIKDGEMGMAAGSLYMVAEIRQHFGRL